MEANGSVKMVSLDELKTVLAKYGYKLLKVTHYKNVDRVRVECEFGFLSVNYRKHIEDYSLREVCDGLLSESQFKHEFGTGV